MKHAKKISRDASDELFNFHAEMCKVLSNPIRLKIINILREKELSVSEIAQKLGYTIGNLSQHLNMMKQRRVLVSRKAGNCVYYRLANPKMLDAFDLIRQILCEQLQKEGVLAQANQRFR